MNLKKAVCTFRGHRWRNQTPYVKTAAPLCVCLRCGDIGWLL